MKKNKVKNRKIEHRNILFFRGSLIIGIFLICTSMTACYFLFVYRPPYVTPLPKVFGLMEVKHGPVIDPKIAIQQALYDARQPYDAVKELDPASYAITIDQNEMVIVTNEKNIAEQIASLQLITSRLTMEGKRFSHLDLRYDKPIITF